MERRLERARAAGQRARSIGPRLGAWVVVLLTALAAELASASGDAELRGALQQARAGQHERAARVFATGRGDCVSAFDSARDRSDCQLLMTLNHYGMRAFCERQLESGQATLAGIREAIRLDPGNLAAHAQELHVLLEAEYEHEGAARYLDPSIRIPLRTIRKLLRDMKKESAEIAALLDARFYHAFGKTAEAREKYRQLEPHGAPGGAQPRTVFVKQNFRNYFAHVLIDSGETVAALRLSRAQLRAAPELPASYALRIAALRESGDLEAATAVQARALGQFPGCFRFTLETLDDGR